MVRADMKRTVRRRAAALAACAIAACAIFWHGDASAQTPSHELTSVLARIAEQEQRLNAQERLLREQQQQITEQRSLIERQRREIEAMAGVSDADLGEIRGAGMPSSALNFQALREDEPISLNRRTPYMTLAQADGAGGSSQAPAATAAPTGPVGEAPPEQQHQTVEALPEGQNALLGRGRLVIEPSLEYSRSSNNRLVFRGAVIAEGLQIGLLEASDTARDTVVASVAARYALTNRLEIEARVPYIYRDDRITTLSQNTTQTTRTYQLNGADVGDLEFSARYQLNEGRNGAPIWVASARVKSDTGRGPFDLERDEQGVATELATGSGFWGVQGGISVLYATDPVVLFANASYLHNIGRDVNKMLGAVMVGHVDPGDSISGGFGFGFALNPRFSYSLGYSHAYVMETETELNDTVQTSSALQVGTLQFGMSFRATERQTFSTSVDVGVTEDAPDVRVSLRAPFRW